MSFSTCHLVDIRIVVKRADICNLLGLLDAPVKLFLFFIAPFMGKGLEMVPFCFDLSRTGFVQRSLRQPSACCDSRVFYETAVLSTHKGSSIHSSDIYIFFFWQLHRIFIIFVRMEVVNGDSQEHIFIFIRV